MSGFQDQGVNELDAAIRGYVNRGEVPGAVVLLSIGDAVFTGAYGVATLENGTPLQRDSIFRISSMTKPLAAAAALTLVDDGALKLDDPVDPWLPELAKRRVLIRIDGPFDDTAPAKRAITVRDLLTLRMGIGHIMARAADYPIRKALDERGLLIGYPRPQAPPEPDEWMRRVGELPLMHQPGEAFMYDLGIDVLGVLIARASGQALEQFMADRIFEPLGMHDTGFHVPAEKLKRFTASYIAAGKDVDVYDRADHNSQWSRPPAFPAAASGLVSTIDDYHAFCQMLLNGGVHDGARILSQDLTAEMTRDQLTPQQRADNPMFFDGHSSWGFGLAVVVEHAGDAVVPGSYGWAGGLGSTFFIDPRNDLIGIILTTRAMDSPQPPGIFNAFRNHVYQLVQSSAKAT